MSISICDRISVAFHQIMGGNISIEAANRLSSVIMDTKKIENMPGDVVRALQHKHDTSRRKDLAQVSAALAWVAAKHNGLEQAGRLAQGKDIINTTEKSVDNYLDTRYVIAAKIEKYFNDDMKYQAIEKLLGDYGVEFDDAKNLAVKLSDQKYVWEKTVAEMGVAAKNRDKIAQMSGATDEDHRQRVAFDKEYSSLLTSIIPLEESILDVETKLEFAQHAKATTLIEVARENKNKLPAKCVELINEADKLEARVMNAPDIIQQTGGRIGEIQRHLDNANVFAERLERVHEELQRTTSAEEANNVLSYFHRVNERDRMQQASIPTTEL